MLGNLCIAMDVGALFEMRSMLGNLCIAMDVGALFAMLSMLENPCIDNDVGGAGEWNELFSAGIEELSLVDVVSCTPLP